MEKIMAVYDLDPGYARRFAAVVNQKEKLPLSVVPFSSWDALQEYGRQHEIRILLVSEQVPQDHLRGVNAGMVIRLSEENQRVAAEEPAVYKYQSADLMVREVMSRYCEEKNGERGEGGLKQARILGVYSPISRCLKTSLALALAQCLASRERVLYLNLENGSGLSGLIGSTGWNSDLADVLYYFRQGELTPMRMNSLACSWKEVELIPPIRYPEDFEGLTGEEAAGMVQQAAGCGYDTVVLDVGNSLHRVLPVLEICKVIYLPVLEDPISAGKLEEFDAHLKEADPGLKERIKRLKLPFHSSFGNKERYLEDLLWGELGDFVRELSRQLSGRE